jgi:putative membrane protein
MITYLNPYAVALHLIFVVTWFSGLFYIVRLFVYHAEAEKRTEPEKSILQEQYKIMERRLWYGITWPSMILVYVFGLWLMSFKFYYYFSSPWFILKLSFVFGLTLYHIKCHVMFMQFQRGIIKYSSFKLRLWNELATVFLVAIVFIVVMKNELNFIWGLVGLILLCATIFFAIVIYRKGREEKRIENK